MTDQDITPEEDDEVERRDPNDPGEVRTRFTTVGLGWSGREDDKDDEDA